MALDRIGPVDPAIFPALASSGAGITVVPRFVAAVASVQPPVTVVLDHAEAVTNRQCLNTIAEFALRLPPGWQFALASRTARAAADGAAARSGRDLRDHRRRPGDGTAGGAVIAGGRRGRGRRGQPSRSPAADRGMASRAVYRRAGHEVRHPARATPASRSPATTFTWATTCARSSWTGSQPRKRRSSPARRSSTGCAGRCATRSWSKTGSGARPRADGSRNLLVVPLDRRREWYRYHHLLRELLQAELRRREPDLVARSPLPGGGLVRGERHAGGGDRARPGGRRLRPGGPAGPRTASSRSGPAGGSRRCCAGWSGSGTSRQPSTTARSPCTAH